MTQQRKKIGAQGEQAAACYLIAQGYHIVARNWRCAEGEIDLVAQQGEMLVFVEVRTRRGTHFGSPEESITPGKQAKLIALAYTYLELSAQPDILWRIDVIGIVLDRQGNIARLNHIEFAVGE